MKATSHDQAAIISHVAARFESFEAGETGVAAAPAAHAADLTHRKAPLHQRISWLNLAATAVDKAADELAALIREDVGKPIRLALFEARRGGDFTWALKDLQIVTQMSDAANLSLPINGTVNDARRVKKTGAPPWTKPSHP